MEEILGDLLFLDDPADVEAPSSVTKVIVNNSEMTTNKIDLQDFVFGLEEEFNKRGWHLTEVKRLPAEHHWHLKSMTKLATGGFVGAGLGFVFIIEEAVAGKVAELLEASE